MPTLTESLDAQIALLKAERDRIESQAAENLADVDRKLAALRGARKSITKDVEAAYDALLALGLIQQVTR
jgi:hypothetical protein